MAEEKMLCFNLIKWKVEETAELCFSSMEATLKIQDIKENILEQIDEEGQSSRVALQRTRISKRTEDSSG